MPWLCRGRALPVEERTLVMGIVNATPDSFSDGGLHLDPAAAIAHGLRLAAEGADLLDVGGESTRPGAQPVPEAEELRRVLPVLEGLRGAGPALSVDTRKPGVAKAALAAGAHVVNDVEALQAPGMAAACAEAGAGVVLMHMRGQPGDMQRDPRYGDVVGEVAAFLRGRARAAEAAGVAREAIVLDPGLGFGKTLEHNVALLRGLPALAALGYPVLVGHSRKAFLGALAGNPEAPPAERLPAGLAAAALAVAGGARILRTHDVRATVQAARVADALVGRGGAPR